MKNIDFGGAKNRNDLEGSWIIMDLAVNSDIHYDLNSGRDFPILDNQIDNWYTSHTLEHASYDITKKILSEFYRTLKPGGLVRIVVPDFELACFLYLRRNGQIFEGPSVPDTYPKTHLGALYGWAHTPNKPVKNNESIFSNGHNSVYDHETMALLLNNSSFANIKFLSYNNCSPCFAGKDLAQHRNYSLYIEAQKV